MSVVSIVVEGAAACASSPRLCTLGSLPARRPAAKARTFPWISKPPGNNDVPWDDYGVGVSAALALGIVLGQYVSADVFDGGEV